MAESSAGLQRLAPFVLGRARRGVVGSSRYAQRLRTAVLALALTAAIGLWLNRRWLYAGLPLLWALLLARHLPIGMAEAGTVLPHGWPQWSADPHVIGFCQTLVVGIGWIGAAILSRRLLDLDSRAWVMGSMVLLLVSFSGRWLVAL